jgi:hypothetical protein
VPWHSGNRVGEYNNMVDFMLLDYYLTGNARALDVTNEIGQLLIRFAKGHPSREGCGIGALLHYYQHTWNAKALLKFTSELPKTYAMPAIKHDPPSVQWGPFLEPWIAYSNDPVAKKFLMELADTLIDRDQRPTGVQHYGDGRVLAMAARLTGDPKYVYHGWSFYNRGPGLSDLPGKPFSGLVDWLNFSFESQQMLPLMAEIKRLGKPITMDQPRYGGRGQITQWLRESPSGEIRAIIPEASDTEFWIGDPRLFSRQDLKYELINPRGEVVLSGDFKRELVDKGGLRITQKKDGITGDYTFRLYGPDEYQISTGLSSLDTQRFVIPEQKTKDEFVIQGRFFFYVPANCEKFTFTLSGVAAYVQRTDRPMVVDIISPDDRVLTSKSVFGSVEPQTIEVSVPEKWRGKIWSLAAVNTRVLDMQGVPRWLAGSYAGAALGKDAAAK